jgi:flavin-binding protein dodecin
MEVPDFSVAGQAKMGYTFYKQGTEDPGRETVQKRKENIMSVYKVIELVGTSSESWEKAAESAVETASKSLRDLRIAEVSELDMQIEDGKIKAYRAKVKLSFKYHTGD